MKRAEYSDFGEPTVQVALRLPESLVAAIDERRGNASRATYVALKMTEAMSPKGGHVVDANVVVTAVRDVSGALGNIVEPVPSEQPCAHHKLVRGTSGLLRCANCGAIQR